MYIPKDFKFDDTNEILSFIRKYPFGILINIQDICQ